MNGSGASRPRTNRLLYDQSGVEVGKYVCDPLMSSAGDLNSCIFVVLRLWNGPGDAKESHSGIDLLYNAARLLCLLMAGRVECNVD